MSRKLLTHNKWVEKIQNRYPGKYEILSEYTGGLNDITVKYLKCGHIKITKARYLESGGGCGICNRGTKLSNDEILERFNNLWPDFELADINEYKNENSIMTIKHKFCGFEFKRNYSSLMTSTKCLICPKCFPKKYKDCIPYVNDVSIMNPELASLLKNEEDRHTHKEFSKEQLVFICPICKSEQINTLLNVAFNGLNCPICCRDGYSYPEKLMANVLEELNVKYITQYSPKWSNSFRYDFYLPDYKIIIEMDGGFHFSDNNLSGVSMHEQQARDFEKEILAENHGLNLIRINCDYKNILKREQFIKESIINSNFKKYFKLDNVNWDKCFKTSQESTFYKIINLWNNSNLLLDEIADELNIVYRTLRNKLNKAFKLGLLKNNSLEDYKKEISIRINEKPHHSTRVKCNETGEIFNSMRDADRKYHANVANYFLDKNRKFSGTLPDGTRLTWEKI